MAFKSKKQQKTRKKDLLNTEIRKKLGVTQAQLATILNVSRAYVALIESGKRNPGSSANTLLLNIYLQFHELETGKQAAYRSLETRLFLNNEYKKILPKMKLMEQDYRLRIKELKKDLEDMKERARDAEHAIIVCTAAIKNLQEKEIPGNKKSRQITAFSYLKEQAYDNLLTCWEPEQAKLHAKIEAVAGEAKALRRYRVKIMREHNPLKKIKKT